MKADTRIYLAATVLAAAAGGLYYTRSQSSKQAQQHTAPTATGSAVAATDLPTFALEKEAAPTKLVIENAGKGKVVLEKKGEAWELVEPIKAPANAAHVKSLLDNLKELKGKEVIDKTAASYASYDLADGKALHVVATLGDGKSHEVWFGKSGSRGQTARVAGRDGVFTVEKYQSFLYAREAKNWRENAIAKVDDAAVESVEVANKHGTFVFTKSGDKWTGQHTGRDKDGKLEKKPQKSWDKLDEAKIKSMLQAYKALTAVDFGEGKEDTGLDALASAPTDKTDGGVITFKTKDGAQTFKVGKTSKGKDRFLVKDGGDGTVFVVSAWSADWAVEGPSKWEKGDDKKGGEPEEPAMPIPGLDE